MKLSFSIRRCLDWLLTKLSSFKGGDEAAGIHLPGRRYNLLFIGTTLSTMLEDAQECNLQSAKLGVVVVVVWGTSGRCWLTSPWLHMESVGQAAFLKRPGVALIPVRCLLQVSSTFRMAELDNESSRDRSCLTSTGPQHFSMLFAWLLSCMCVASLCLELQYLL